MVVMDHNGKHGYDKSVEITKLKLHRSPKTEEETINLSDLYIDFFDGVPKSEWNRIGHILLETTGGKYPVIAPTFILLIAEFGAFEDEVKNAAAKSLLALGDKIYRGTLLDIIRFTPDMSISTKASQRIASGEFKDFSNKKRLPRR
jgi:hypothetical protein